MWFSAAYADPLPVIGNAHTSLSVIFHKRTTAENGEAPIPIQNQYNGITAEVEG